ncbi:hypothetical protein D3C78_1599240 [compost metagenome]
MILADVFVVVEILDRVFNGGIRQTQQETWRGQTQIAGVFRLAQRTPFGMCWPFEHRLHVFDGWQLGKAVDTKEVRRNAGKERRMCHGPNGADVLQQLHIRGAVAERIVTDDGCGRFAAKLAVTG